MGSTFIAYIDESGDEGFVPDSGASVWFVLGAIVVRRASELAVVKLIDEVRQGINLRRQPQHRIPDKKPLHFRDLGHEQRKFYASHISQADLHTVSVLINKQAIVAPENFIEQTRPYFYAVRLLIERLSWYCRDHIRKEDIGDGSVADAVASSYFFAIETNRYGFTEDSYAKLLLPRAYRHQGQLWGYGIKIMPRETEEKRRDGTLLIGW